MSLAISVIIPAYNPANGFEDLIRGLASQSTELEYEIIIIDDCSSPTIYRRMEELVQSLNKKRNIHLLTTLKNSGPAHARNLGVSHSQGNFLLFIDSDCFIRDPKYLDKACRLLSERPDHIVGGTVYGVGRGYIAFTDHFCHWITNLPGYTGPAPEPHIVSTNMLMTRDAWKRVGPLNEFLRSGEDVEMCFSATAQGIPLWLTDELQIGHYDRETFTALFSNYFFCGSYRHYFYGKHHVGKRFIVSGPRWLRALLIPVVTIGLVVRYLVGWWNYDKKIVLAVPGITLACFAMALGLAVGLPERKQFSVLVHANQV